jgi:HD superfamily phosphodiesterase
VQLIPCADRSHSENDMVAYTRTALQVNSMVERAVMEMIRTFGSDVRRINHALKVYGFAQAIAETENVSGKCRVVIGLAAALHDIGIPEAERKYGSSAGNLQEREGPPVARLILEGLGVDPETVDRVCHLIGHHHSYGEIDGLDFQILVEADFLVNIYEDSMGREAIQSIQSKYFKTGAGVGLLEGMYLR